MAANYMKFIVLDAIQGYMREKETTNSSNQEQAQLLLNFLPQRNTNRHPLYEPDLLMLPSEGTDSIHHPLHLPERHTMHPLVQILKGSFHGIGIGVIAFMVIDVEHLQDGVGITAVVGWILCHMAFQDLDILIHSRYRPSLLPASFCRPGGSCFGTAGTRPYPGIP